MSRTRLYRVGATCAAALTVASVIAGCNSSKSSSSAASTTSTSASASSSASAVPTPASSAAVAAPATSAASVPAASTLAGSLAALESQAAAAGSAPVALPTKVVATKGGTFCKEAAAVSNAGLSSASGGITPAAIKAQVTQFQGEEKLILGTAPGQIKPDLVTLFGSIDKLYAALAAAGYDYTKLDSSTLTSFDTPAFEAASDRLDAFLKTDCGIDTGADATPGAS